MIQQEIFVTGILPDYHDGFLANLKNYTDKKPLTEKSQAIYAGSSGMFFARYHACTASSR